VIVVNRVLGFILGLALAATGVIVVGEVVLGVVGRGPWLIDRTLANRELAELTWRDPRVLPVSVALLAIGIVLALMQLKPRRPTTLPLPQSTERRRFGIERRSVETHLATIAQNDYDVATARARVGKRRATIKAKAAPGATLPTVEDRVRVSLSNELERLGLRHTLNVRTRPE
jgi:hypothetical protein